MHHLPISGSFKCADDRQAARQEERAILEFLEGSGVPPTALNLHHEKEWRRQKAAMHEGCDYGRARAIYLEIQRDREEAERERELQCLKAFRYQIAKNLLELKEQVRWLQVLEGERRRIRSPRMRYHLGDAIEINIRNITKLRREIECYKSKFVNSDSFFIRRQEDYVIAIAKEFRNVRLLQMANNLVKGKGECKPISIDHRDMQMIALCLEQRQLVAAGFEVDQVEMTPVV